MKRFEPKRFEPTRVDAAGLYPSDWGIWDNKLKGFVRPRYLVFDDSEEAARVCEAYETAFPDKA